MPKTAKN